MELIMNINKYILSVLMISAASANAASIATILQALYREYAKYGHQRVKLTIDPKFDTIKVN